MRSLNDLTIKERIVATVIIVLAALFGLALWGWLTGGWDQYSANGPLFELESSSSRNVRLGAQEPLYPDDIPVDEKLLHLDERALDEAYHQQLLLLFSVWLKDQAGDTTRFNNGLRIARRAYHTVAERLDAREKQIPPRQ